ncbi:MAG: hypothetical protein FJ086_12320 [Deltaproteobacteria bacterium]|nr:hypothetical protein [Deltaproteobacteria bacterium]
MKQALAVGGSAILAGALLTATVGMWQGRLSASRATSVVTPPGTAGAPAQRAGPGSGQAPEVDGAREEAPVDAGAASAGPGSDAGQHPVAGAGGADEAPAGPRGPLPMELVARGALRSGTRAVPPAGSPSTRKGVVRAPTAAGQPAPTETGAGGAAAAGVPVAETAGVATVRPAEPGRLQLRVVPWAQAWLDGNALGEVGPQREFPLAPGAHQLRLEHPRGTHQLTVQVKPGEVTVLALDMLAP